VLAQSREKADDPARHETRGFSETMGCVGAGEISKLIKAPAELDKPPIFAKALEVNQRDASRLEIAGARDASLLCQGEGTIGGRFYDLSHGLLYIAVNYKQKLSKYNNWWPIPVRS
jgi:hypothetical protein